MTIPTPSPWLSIDQVADRLQVSVRTVERMVASGRLTERRPLEGSRTRRYHVDDVDQAMQPATDPDCSVCADIGGPHGVPQPDPND